MFDRDKSVHGIQVVIPVDILGWLNSQNNFNLNIIAKQIIKTEHLSEMYIKCVLHIVQRIPTHPPVIVPLDLAELGTLPQKIADILAIHGHIDILVNNGGISVRADALSAAIDVDVRVMQVCSTKFKQTLFVS